MENLLELYNKPRDVLHPVVCLDEKSKQLLEDSRLGKSSLPGEIAIRDYEYVRKGTRNIFVAVEPKGGRHFTKVTARRTKKDYAEFLAELVIEYPAAEILHIVQDNLNTHSEKSLLLAFGKRKTKQMMKRIKFHFTPKHASWLNMAEIEIGILSRQCLKGRIPSEEKMKREVSAWTKDRNKKGSLIKWGFGTDKAKIAFPTLYE
ncbi:MAG: IS630 family transposase [Candidatus Gracilibacteria bacterium]